MRNQATKKKKKRKIKSVHITIEQTKVDHMRVSDSTCDRCTDSSWLDKTEIMHDVHVHFFGCK